jgi:hypothetical protein
MINIMAMDVNKKLNLVVNRAKLRKKTSTRQLVRRRIKIKLAAINKIKCQLRL